MKQIISIDLAGQLKYDNAKANPPYTPHTDWRTNIPANYILINDQQPASNAGQIPLPNPPAASSVTSTPSNIGATRGKGARTRNKRDVPAICPLPALTSAAGAATTSPTTATLSCDHQDETVRIPRIHLERS